MRTQRLALARHRFECIDAAIRIGQRAGVGGAEEAATGVGGDGGEPTSRSADGLTTLEPKKPGTVMRSAPMPMV